MVLSKVRGKCAVKEGAWAGRTEFRVLGPQPSDHQGYNVQPRRSCRGCWVTQVWDLIYRHSGLRAGLFIPGPTMRLWLGDRCTKSQSGTSGAPSWGRYPALPDSVSRRNTCGVRTTPR